MRRLLSSVAALAFVLTLAGGPALAKDKMGAMGGMSMGTTCPKGSVWVKGYTNKKTGKMVKGYCRKAPKMKGM